MSTAAHAEQLRARAEELRRLSTQISRSSALTVYRLADPDTWVGPTAQACYDALVAVSRQLQDQQQRLARTASGFERRATELDRLPPARVVLS